MADVADLRVKYSADTRDFEAGADRVNRGIKDFAKNAGAFAAGDLLAGGIRAIGGAAMGAIGGLSGMAMEAAELDKQISGVIALAGGGAEDFDKLAAAIDSLAINPNLIVDSNEAATVIQNLIANGLTLQDVYNGAAEATVLLANATGGSFEDASTIATDTMAIFGVEAENMMTAVDGITRVTNASKLSLQDYGYALAQSAAQAQSAGVELDDYNTGLVAINNNFSGGSDLGTGLRNFYTRLVPSTKPAMEAMAEIGLLTTDYAGAAERLGDILGYEVAPNQYAVADAFNAMSRAQGIDTKNLKQLNKAWDAFADDFQRNAFFDEDGLLKSSDQIAGALNEALAPLNEMDKSRILNEIFGADAARAALGFAEYTAEEFRALSTEINGLAGAQENAQIRNNNLAGDMAAFGGTVDSVRKKIGREFEPALRTLFQSGNTLLTDLQPAIIGIADSLANGLERATPSVLAAIEGIVGAASVVARDGFGALFKTLEDGSTYAGSFAGALGMNEDAVNRFIGLVGVVNEQGFGALFRTLEDGSTYIGSFAVSLGASEEAVNRFTGLMRVAGEQGFGALFKELDDGSTYAGEFAKSLGANEAAVDSFTATVFRLKSAFQSGGFKGLFDEAFAGIDISTALDGLRTKLSEAFANFDFSTSVQTAKGQVNGFRDSILTSITETINGINWETVSLSFAGLVDSVTTSVNEINWSEINWTDVGLRIVSFLSPGIGLAIKGAQWVISSDNFSSLVTSVRTALDGITWGDIGASFTKLSDAIATGIAKIDTSSLSAIFTGTDYAGVATNLDAVGAAFGRVFAQLRSFAEITNLAGAGDAIGRITAQLGAASEIGQSAGYFKELGDSLRQLDESGKGAFAGANEGASAFLASIKELDKYGEGLGTKFNEAFTWDFATVDKQFNDFVASIPGKLAGIPDLLGFGESTPAWLTTLQGWTWPDLTALTGWTWPTLPTWTWTDYPTWSWPDYLTFTWPAYTAWTWTAYPTWTWPNIPRPAWLDAMLSWDPSAAIRSATSSATNAISNAFGLGNASVRNPGSIAPSGSNTSNNGGGYVPSGASGRALGMPALAGAGGGNIIININGYNQDEESLARRIAAIIQRRG